MRSFRKHWPLVIAILVYLATVAVLLYLSVRSNQGHFVYSYDDAYIHMSVAKNAVQHGVWGVTRYGFTSSCSSILWPFLLALSYQISGVNQFSPFMLNLMFGVLAIVAGYLILEKSSSRPLFALSGLLFMIFVTPLTSLAFTGMEHSLHLFLSLLFVYLVARHLSGARPGPGEHLSLLILAPLVSSARYEGLFLILVVGVLAFVGGRRKLSFLLVGAGSLPVLGSGLISLAKGWYFFPNSLLVKAGVPSIDSLPSLIELLGKASARRISQNPQFLLLLLLSLFLVIYYARKSENPWRGFHLWSNSAFVGTLLLHSQFVGLGWGYRYDAYLMALGTAVVAGALFDLAPVRFLSKRHWNSTIQYLAIAILIAVAVHPFAGRSASKLRGTPQATTNIFEQQYQMGLFLHRFYEGQSIAANDIGAINYLADINVVDLIGLANIQVATLKFAGTYGEQQIRNLTVAEGTTIAIIYDDWFPLPKEWIKVGEWTILNNVVCGEDTVSFFAASPKQRDKLIANLRTFSSQLPPSVIESGEYTR